MKISTRQNKQSSLSEESINQMDAFGLEEMYQCGQQIAALMTIPSVVYLQGGLGAGKTTLVQGIARFFNYPGIVSSPTYNLIHEYLCVTENGNVNIAHLDLYRLEDSEELDMLGLGDLLTNNSILLIEWPEKGNSRIPRYDFKIKITDISSLDNHRIGRRLQIETQ